MSSGLVVVWVLAVFGCLVAASPEPAFPEDVEPSARSPQRIVSGWEAEEGQIPHQISIRMVNTIGTVSSCGGSIIHHEWGLTAAHCTATRPTIVIRAGLVNLTRPEYIFETTTWFNHPLYIDALQTVVQPNDIALLKFERFLPYTDYTKPIRIQSSEDMNKNYEGHRLVASGWGRTWTNGAAPENLNWVFLLGVTNLDCRVAYNFSPIIVDSTICASAYNVSSQSTCQGDSGGPLTVVEDDGELTQIGVTSFVSSGGCHTSVPAGFVRPGPYHDWITEVTGLNFDSSRPDPTTEVPDATTEATEATTIAPKETTAAPEETTAAPEETTAAPKETTSAPEGTTAASEETTAAPAETTAVPEETTAAPKETTAASKETTAVPEETTLAPEETTVAPEKTTVAPEETTAAPKETTAASKETTAVPEETTLAPEETTVAPEKTTVAPEETTAAPEGTTESPKDSQESVEELETEKSFWSRLKPSNVFKFLY